MPVDRNRVDSSLVLIPVHVTSAIGATVADMRKEDFHVYEDNVEQRVTTFSVEDAPVSVGILFDASGSMRGRMREAAEAVHAFLGAANRMLKKGPGTSHSDHRLKSVPPIISDLAAHGGTGFSL
jgi:hypothetical protein